MGNTVTDTDDKDDVDDTRTENTVKGFSTEEQTDDTLAPNNRNYSNNEDAETLRNETRFDIDIGTGKSVCDRNGTNQPSGDDDTTAPSVVSLLESASSTATTAAATPPSPGNRTGTARRRNVQDREDHSTASTRGAARGERDGAVGDGPQRQHLRHGSDPRIERSVQFLRHPSIVRLSSTEKDAYLSFKGLSNDEIKISKRAATMVVRVTNPITMDIDPNTNDDDSESESESESDSINSDDYLELSRRNVSYRRTRNTDEGTTRGGGVHTAPLSLWKDSVVDNDNDRTLTAISKTERKRRGRSTDRSIVQEQQPQAMDNAFVPIPAQIVGRFIIIAAVLFGTLVVAMMLLPCWLSGGDNYFLCLPSSSTSSTTTSNNAISRTIDARLQIRVNEKKNKLLLDDVIDQLKDVEEVDKDGDSVAFTPTSLTTAPIAIDSIPRNIDNCLHAGIKEKISIQGDANVPIYETRDNRLNAPLLAGERSNGCTSTKDLLVCNNIDEVEGVKEKDIEYNAYPSDQASNNENMGQHMQNVDDNDYNASCRIGNILQNMRTSVSQPNRQNVKLSLQPHCFTKPIKTISSLHGRLSMLPLTQKVRTKVGSATDLWNQDAAYLVDEAIGRTIVHHPAEESARHGDGQKTPSDVIILAQLTELKSMLNSMKGEIMNQRYSNDQEQSKEDNHEEDMCNSNASEPCRNMNTISNEFEKISTALRRIEFKLKYEGITVQERSTSNCEKIAEEKKYKSDTVFSLHREMPIGRQDEFKHHTETSTYSTPIRYHHRQNQDSTNSVHQHVKSSTNEYSQVLLPRFLKRTLQIMGHIISKIGVGFKFILRMPQRR